uniref:ADP-ribosylation factor n=1 Tax=Solanum tuberosum TaxID=4113 RepID=M1BEC5_SOLTU
MGKTRVSSVQLLASTSKPSRMRSICSIYGMSGGRKQYDLIGETTLSKPMAWCGLWIVLI